MIITEEIKDVVVKSPFISMVTLSPEGQPHMIVVGKGEVLEDDVLRFGIYKMEKTQRNIKNDDRMQIAVASKEGGPKGFRLSGKACIKDSSVLLKVEAAEPML